MEANFAELKVIFGRFAHVNAQPMIVLQCCPAHVCNSHAHEHACVTEFAKGAAVCIKVQRDKIDCLLQGHWLVIDNMNLLFGQRLLYAAEHTT